MFRPNSPDKESLVGQKGRPPPVGRLVVGLSGILIVNSVENSTWNVEQDIEVDSNVRLESVYFAR